MERPEPLWKSSVKARARLLAREIAALKHTRTFKEGTLLPHKDYIRRSQKIENLRAEIIEQVKILQSAS